MSKTEDTYRVFLEALRPLVADTPALAALDDYIAARAERAVVPGESAGRKRNAEHAHVWVPTKNNTAVRDGAPPKAITTLSKPDCQLFACSRCGILSNRKYPYWFRLADYSWQMAKPVCVPVDGAPAALRDAAHDAAIATARVQILDYVRHHPLSTAAQLQSGITSNSANLIEARKSLVAAGVLIEKQDGRALRYFVK